jgi:hypothetical protein
VTKVSTESLKPEVNGTFSELCKKVSNFLEKALSNDIKVSILSGDCDNLGAATIIYYLISQHKLPFS